MNPLYRQYADELNLYVIDFEKEDIGGVKGKIAFMFLKDENSGYGFKSKNLPLFEHRGEKLFRELRFIGEIENENQQILSQDGILIKKIGRFEYYETILPPWIEDDFIFFDVNLEDESKIDLTIDRNDFVANSKKLNDLNRKTEEIIIDHIEKIFSQKHLVTDKDKNRFMERFFKTFIGYYPPYKSNFFLESMKKLIIFECFVNGKIKYLKYGELKDRWKYFHYLFTVPKAFRNKSSINMRKAIEKAYPRDPLIYSYSASAKELPGLLLEFSGEHIIVTNKELEFSFDKFLLLPSAEKRDKKEYGCTFEGDYKDCFGTLTTESFYIESNINHPFIRLVNKNISAFKGKDKEDHMVLIHACSDKRLTF